MTMSSRPNQLRDNNGPDHCCGQRRRYCPGSSRNAIKNQCITTVKRCNWGIVSPSPSLITLRFPVGWRRKAYLIDQRTGWNRMVSVQGDRDIVRVHRRCITKCIGSTKAFAGFNDQLDIEACHLMLRIMKQPDDLANHIRR